MGGLKILWDYAANKKNSMSIEHITFDIDICIYEPVCVRLLNNLVFMKNKLQKSLSKKQHNT